MSCDVVVAELSSTLSRACLRLFVQTVWQYHSICLDFLLYFPNNIIIAVVLIFLPEGAPIVKSNRLVFDRV